MKAVTVIASPRKNGNCKQIVDIITAKIEEKNGSNNIYFVDDLKIRGCQACRACKNMENPTKCVLDDDFNRIMCEVEESDAFIFAAPNYFGEISGQGRIFMDRFFSMTKTTPNQLKNNPKCILIHTYGASQGHYDEYINKKAKIFDSIGCTLLEVLSVGNNRPSSEKSDKLTEHVKELADKLGD
ncbi:MAG: hypothetical protein BZ138_00880 [Methanosphaera sp. rholeuAM270]|nr:MAG: hypothetical protein BZ138_00880 [Methanosphaera sp. rholeuAM270]